MPEAVADSAVPLATAKTPISSPSSHALVKSEAVVARVCGRPASAVAAGAAKPISKRMSPLSVPMPSGFPGTSSLLHAVSSTAGTAAASSHRVIGYLFFMFCYFICFNI